jgi:hypothetical protein
MADCLLKEDLKINRKNLSKEMMWIQIGEML